MPMRLSQVFMRSSKDDQSCVRKQDRRLVATGCARKDTRSSIHLHGTTQLFRITLSLMYRENTETYFIHTVGLTLH